MKRVVRIQRQGKVKDVGLRWPAAVPVAAFVDSSANTQYPIIHLAAYRPVAL